MAESDPPPAYNSLYPFEPGPPPSAPIEDRPVPYRKPRRVLPPTPAIAFGDKATTLRCPQPSAPIKDRPVSPRIPSCMLPPTSGATVTCPQPSAPIKDRLVSPRIPSLVLPPASTSFGPETAKLTCPPPSAPIKDRPVSPQIPPRVLPPTCAVAFGPQAVTLTCPSCHAVVKTKLKTTQSAASHLAAFLLFVIGCYLCFCLPYCFDCWKSTLHYCPKCKAYLGKYHK